MSRNNSLFADYDWFSVEQNHKTKLQEEVAAYDENRLLNTSVDDLGTYFSDKYALDVPEIDRNGIVADQRETKVDVSHDHRYFSPMDGRRNMVDGSTVEIEVPFTGDPQLFNVRPTTASMSPPKAGIRGNALLLKFTGVNQSADEVKSKIESELSQIETHLERLRGSATILNASLKGIATSAIESRRQKLLANQNLVSSLGFSLKKNPNSSETYTAPSVRRKLVPTPPPASGKPYEPEPSLSTNDYDHILDVIQNMAHVMERSPAAFQSMDEETLRTHFLVQLNGQYEGQATGETFNYEGKTDILIRQDDRNIFIGECKFWSGPKKHTDTIDQLLGYSSWRDTKVAVLVFNRNRDMSKVLETAHEATSNHSNCKKIIGKQSETSFRYLFSHRDDANREMTLSLMIFDVPQ